MKTGKSFASLFAKARERDAYWVEKSILTFTAELYRLVEAGHLSRAELARRLGTSPAYITKVFRGDVNFTVESMVKLARAAGGMLHIHVAPDDCVENLIDCDLLKKARAEVRRAGTIPWEKVKADAGR